MEYHLRENLSIKSLWQVPWGKHRVPYVRLQHVAPGMTQIQQEDVLPIIMIRDPFHWMQSMCKSPYAAHWKKTRLHCPNLVPSSHDLQRFGPALAATNHTYPRLIVRFDDMLLHAPTILRVIGCCAGVDASSTPVSDEDHAIPNTTVDRLLQQLEDYKVRAKATKFARQKLMILYYFKQPLEQLLLL